jgi:hypothetical protein
MLKAISMKISALFIHWVALYAGLSNLLAGAYFLKRLDFYTIYPGRFFLISVIFFLISLGFRQYCESPKRASLVIYLVLGFVAILTILFVKPTL